MYQTNSIIYILFVTAIIGQANAIKTLTIYFLCTNFHIIYVFTIWTRMSYMRIYLFKFECYLVSYTNFVCIETSNYSNH